MCELCVNYARACKSGHIQSDNGKFNYKCAIGKNKNSSYIATLGMKMCLNTLKSENSSFPNKN